MMPFSVALVGVVLDCPDALALAGFYRRLLGWTVRPGATVQWAEVEPPDGGTRLSFQQEPLYQPPIWPSRADGRQMMLHLDLRVDDLAAAQEHAVEVGARLADFQPQAHVRVFLDPAGHPFCFYVDEGFRATAQN